MKSLMTAAALMAATALPAAAFDPANMTDAEKAAFGVAVKDYIMANPQVLIEAVNSLEAQRVADEVQKDRQLVQTFQKDLTQDSHSWVGGNPDGKLTMVEFIDYRCGYCRKVNPEVEELVKTDGDIRWVLKEFPILGPESELASRFAIAVKQLDGPAAYKAVHDKLYVMRGDVTTESLKAIATELKLDDAAIEKHMSSADVTAEIQANHELGQKMGIMGTPTFVIGNEMLRGIPSTGMTEAVKQIRAQSTAG
ncbi:MAG: disulfide bond formation protein DsbA [Paracoccus denitrificans]|nr:MAG: disulfide bond formation protein DsbA [Paracoccus denitrificans]PZO84176.1 MAG: disulfide bond formation protein DsbA [Paracoccus denitrificans]